MSRPISIRISYPKSCSFCSRIITINEWATVEDGKYMCEQCQKEGK